MHKDPEMNWQGAFPYDVLAPAGVTPQSSMQELRDSKRYFTRQQPRQMASALNAYNALETVKNRLFIDFFLYRTEPAVDTVETGETEHD